jgi:hypothetical protein
MIICSQLTINLLVSGRHLTEFTSTLTHAGGLDKVENDATHGHTFFLC